MVLPSNSDTHTSFWERVRGAAIATITGKAIATLYGREGASVISAVITHGVLSGPAIKRIVESPLQELVITDTIALTDEARDCEKLHVVTIAPLLGEAIRRINNEESVSSLFV